MAYFSDHHEVKEFTHYIRFVFRVPSDDQMEDFRALFVAAFESVDQAVTASFPKAIDEKISKKRAELNKTLMKLEHEKREERSQQLKDEKKRKLLDTKNEEELAKLEAREKKRSTKKSAGKVKRVVVG